jgi:D-alanyl-D-alanine carboxypeptidase
MKTLFKWFLCTAMGVLLLAAGSKLIKDQGIKIGNNLTQAAIAQTASDDVLLVNALSPLPAGLNIGELVDLYGEERSFQLALSDISLTRETFDAANDMFKQAQKDGVKGFTITSGYRTEEKQRELYENDKDGTAAKPGTSEHQTGLAFDVTTRYDKGSFEDTEQFRWLSDHCWDFGFILRYPEGKEDITGIPYEPWHYRYVGVEIAQEIHENGWTLEEYCERNGY